MTHAIPITPDIDEAALRRFWAKVALPDENGCLLWTAWQGRDGYARFGHAGRMVLAHRFAYTALIGPIPEGLVLDHVRDRGCASRACVNPCHLEPVTNAENMRRGEHAARTHCPQGHLYSGENLYVAPDGRRQCRACRATQERTLRGHKRNPPNAAKTHCPQGHPYSGENLRIERNGNRKCRICRRNARGGRAGSLGMMGSSPR